MTVVIIVGTTETASIPGLSAAGATPELVAHTPAADAEIVTYGRPVLAPTLPVSPTGCPTPAAITRAVREVVGFDLIVIEAGLVGDTAAPTIHAAARPGADIRTSVAVPHANTIVRTAYELGRSIPAPELIVGESIPGGTTTALGVLTALGESHGVSSSLPENPLALKREVVETGLTASQISPGDVEGDPVDAIRLMGDPVLAALTGFVRGARTRGVQVTLAGGTQMLAVAALLRHGGDSSPIDIATTPFVVRDPSAGIERAAAELDVHLHVTDPGFDGATHPAMRAFSAGEGKEGVGMGGALYLAEREGVSMQQIRTRFVEWYEQEVVEDGS